MNLTSSLVHLQVLIPPDEELAVVGPGQLFEALAMGVLFFVMIGWIAGAMSTKRDRDWLPAMIMWAFAAKLTGVVARFWMVTVLYESGDSFTYHAIGRIMAQVWRGFAVPVSNSGQPGTAFAEVVTGFLYAPYTPSLLGGYLIFGTVAFIGQLFFYAAVRHWLDGQQLRLYALGVLFLPSLVFWPSSIGKDALMVCFLGLATYGASRLLKYYQFSALFFIAPGLYLAASIRSHVAAVMGLAIVLAVLFGKPPKKYQGTPKRAVMILVCAAGAALSIATFSSTFGVSVDGGDGTTSPDEFLADVSEQTATGGSQVEGGAVGSPAQLPGAIIKVLYRPLVYEAGSMQALASALEGTALLLITLWKLPTMWRNKRRLREKPLLLMAFFYTGGFIVGFSAVLNLGILARQRVQVLPLFLALLVGLGWDETVRRRKRSTEPEEPSTESIEEAVEKVVRRGPSRSPLPPVSSR